MNSVRPILSGVATHILSLAIGFAFPFTIYLFPFGTIQRLGWLTSDDQLIFGTALLLSCVASGLAFLFARIDRTHALRWAVLLFLGPLVYSIPFMRSDTKIAISFLAALIVSAIVGAFLGAHTSRDADAK